MTRIWPSHIDEAPMPMVGIDTDSVMARANGSTVPSTTSAKAPASAIAAASAETPLGPLLTAALHLEAAGCVH